MKTSVCTTMPPHPYLLLKQSPKHQFKAVDRDIASEIVGPVTFFCLCSIKPTFCLCSPVQANQKCSDLHRPWSGFLLFGLRLSCALSYFKVPTAACPVLPISLSGKTESLIYCPAALMHPISPFSLSIRNHKASLPCCLHLQMAYWLYCEKINISSIENQFKMLQVTP